MERVQGRRSNGIYYVDTESFTYTKDKSTPTARYFRCTVRECPGRAIARVAVADGDIIMSAPHTHNPDVGAVGVLRFKQVLRTRAFQDTAPLRSLFLDEQANQNHDYAAVLRVPGYSGGVEKLMRRARSKGMPPIPGNFSEMDESLRDPSIESADYDYVKAIL